MNATTETNSYPVLEYSGPDRLCRVNGRVQISVKFRPVCRDGRGNLCLPAAWTASALGWFRGTDLVGECSDKQSLIDYCQDRFPDCEINED